jgi:hypothetical protein
VIEADLGKGALNLDRKRIKKLRTKANCEINWVIAMKIANAKTILLSMPFPAMRRTA